MKTVNTAFRRGIVHFCQSCHRMANSDKPQSGKFILYSSPLEFAALLRVIACLIIIVRIFCAGVAMVSSGVPALYAWHCVLLGGLAGSIHILVRNVLLRFSFPDNGGQIAASGFNAVVGLLLIPGMATQNKGFPDCFC